MKDLNENCWLSACLHPLLLSSVRPFLNPSLFLSPERLTAPAGNHLPGPHSTLEPLPCPMPQSIPTNIDGGGRRRRGEEDREGGGRERERGKMRRGLLCLHALQSLTSPRICPRPVCIYNIASKPISLLSLPPYARHNAASSPPVPCNRAGTGSP